MKRTIVWAAFGAAAAMSVPQALALGSDFLTLDPAQCRAVEPALELPPHWEKYRASVRDCAIHRGTETAQLRLLTVFVASYYQHLPRDAPWEAFPMPMLLDHRGRCLAQLAHLFPSEPPSTLVVQAGRWRSGWPQELRFSVKNPAVGGNYRLPTLVWDTDSSSYRAVGNMTDISKRKTLCPQTLAPSPS